MPLTFNTKTYTADSFQKDQVAYAGALNTVSVKDILKMLRQAVVPTSLFSGLSRTEARLTKTLTLTGALTPTGDMTLRCLVSVPVGYASADVDAAINDFAALIAHADFKTHVKSQKISY